MSKVKKYIILIILFIITISCNACFNKTISFKEYKNILEDISLMEQDYKNIKDKENRREENYKEYIGYKIDSITAGNKDQYTFYLSKLNLDKYYILSSYTTIDNIKTKDERKEMTSKELINYYGNLTWVKYKTKEDIQEEYNELILVESYIVSSITIIKDIISDKTYNKKINYYKILDENIKEDENILLWYHKDIDNMEDKYIGYPIYLDSHPVIYGDDFNNSYSEDIDSYVVINRGSSLSLTRAEIQIADYVIYDDSLNKIEYKEDGTTWTIERFKINTEVIKDICLGKDIYINPTYKEYEDAVKAIAKLEKRSHGEIYIYPDDDKYEHTLYIANFNLDDYYILSCYTETGNGIAYKRTHSLDCFSVWLKTFTWVKYEKIEDIKEEYNGLKLVKSYVVSQIILKEDIINNITYNKPLKYYKEYDKDDLNWEAEHTLLLWFHKDIENMTMEVEFTDGYKEIYPKSIDYRSYLNEADIIVFGNDLSFEYKENEEQYILFSENYVKNLDSEKQKYFIEDNIIYNGQIIKRYKLNIKNLKDINYRGAYE